ncbi:MAG: dTDP-4-amino-4,6-dideoxygalactose transaminase [Acidobacteriota bacterium]|jgi:dTDP-4-amino-4,6-dideoxygalactose transaminase|nr:dTDP-4-amino-4,6-dideoxygalactose transaminase [Acidobacteriota bacterium]
MAEYSIPFNRPAQVGTEFRYMQEAVAKGKISGDGEFTRRCQAILERELGAARVLLTTSCTHALEMTALLLDIQPGDEVILPSFTFVSSVNAYALRGARPVFADIRPDTLNLDERQLDGLVTERTRAIMPVHYAGVACEMEPILAAAARVGAAVVEDNAHGFLGKWNGRMLGSLGALSTLSFHETKNFTAGEGGAIVVNDPRYVERAEIVREKGTNRTKFFRGEIDRYSWVDLGSSYVPSELLAAFLYAQLEERERIQATRGALWERYREHLTPWAGEHGVRLPIVPAGCEQPAHIFYMLLPSLAVRQALIEHLKARGILAVFHYVPLHLSDYARQVGSRGDCPVAADLSDRLLRLPLYFNLSEADQMRVIEAVLSFHGF